MAKSAPRSWPRVGDDANNKLIEMKKTLRNQTEKWLEMQSKINSALKTLCAWCCVDETIILNQEGIDRLILADYPRTITYHWITIKDCKSTITDLTRNIPIGVEVDPRTITIKIEGFTAYITNEEIRFSSGRVAADQVRAMKRLKPMNWITR